MYFPRPLNLSVLLLGASVILQSSLQAVPLLSDSFLTGGSPTEYNAGSIQDQQPTGTTGFTGAWTTSAGNGPFPPNPDFVVQPGGLSVTGVESAGGSLFMPTNLGSGGYFYQSFRSADVTVASPTTLWFGIMMQLDNVQSNFNNSAWRLDRTGAPEFNNRFSMRAGTNGEVGIDYNDNGRQTAFSSGFGLQANETVWLVMRMDIDTAVGADETMYLWAYTENAPLSEPLIADALVTVNADEWDADTQLATQRLQSTYLNNNFQSNPTFDEMRMGLSYEDVRSIPEPNASVLVGLCALTLLLSRRASR